MKVLGVGWVRCGGGRWRGGAAHVFSWWHTCGSRDEYVCVCVYMYVMGLESGGLCRVGEYGAAPSVVFFFILVHLSIVAEALTEEVLNNAKFRMTASEIG